MGNASTCVTHIGCSRGICHIGCSHGLPDFLFCTGKVRLYRILRYSKFTRNLRLFLFLKIICNNTKFLHFRKTVVNNLPEKSLFLPVLHDVGDNVERIIISLHHFVDAGIDIFAGFLIIVSKSSNFFNFLFISYNIVPKYHECFIFQFFPQTKRPHRNIYYFYEISSYFYLENNLL